MLIGISVLFIVCVAPLALFRVVWLFQPEMNLGRRYHNLFATGLSVLETLAYVNATFNIFVYYSIGTRYRKTFLGAARKTEARTRLRGCQALQSDHIIILHGEETCLYMGEEWYMK